jgi:peroxiredoxin
MQDYQQMSGANQKTEEERLTQFVKANPGSFAAVYLLNGYVNRMELEKVEGLYASLSPKYKDTRSGKSIIKGIEARKITAIGKTAPDFTQPDTLGNSVTLSSLRGQYVLVDFWASWCGPCRTENPNLVKTFNQYKDKGFTVLGVSLDQPGKKDAWLAAVHKDNLTWTQVSDLKFWENEAAVLYGIKAIPANLLLDKEGKIIAKDLRGEELNKKLSELFGG